MEIDTLLTEELVKVVDEHLANDSPPETGEAFVRLIRAGFSEEETKAMIARVLVIEMHTHTSEGDSFSRQRYRRLLAQLPELPREHWD